MDRPAALVGRDEQPDGNGASRGGDAVQRGVLKPGVDAVDEKQVAGMLRLAADGIMRDLDVAQAVPPTVRPSISSVG